MEDKTTNIKERILYIAEYKGISKEKFFEELGLSYGNFKGKSKNTPINSNSIADISAKHPDVNLEWLLLGAGEMIKSFDVEKKLLVAEEYDNPYDKGWKYKYDMLHEKYTALLEEHNALLKQIHTDKSAM